MHINKYIYYMLLYHIYIYIVCIYNIYIYMYVSIRRLHAAIKKKRIIRKPSRSFAGCLLVPKATFHSGWLVFDCFISTFQKATPLQACLQLIGVVALIAVIQGLGYRLAPPPRSQKNGDLVF